MNTMVTHILRGLQLLLAIIELGLGADGCAQWPGGYAPSQNAFIVFVAIWTLLVTLYFVLAPRFFAPAAHPWAKVAVDGLTMLFWFAGFIALGVLAGAINGVDEFGFDFGGFDDHWYKVTAASSGIGAIEWILFVVTFVFSILEAVRGPSSSKAQRNHVAANPEVQV